MKETTNTIHDNLVALGQFLGFRAEREVSSSVLSLRLGDGDGYRPHIDLMWSVPLTAPQRAALEWALERDAGAITHVPVVGIEVEGTTPTTKTLAADIANITALGPPLGLLVVSVAGEEDIYRRAVRAIRSVRRSYGDRPIIPLDASWVEELLGARDWCRPRLSVLPTKGAAPGGGESLEWGRATRAEVIRRGQEAGFEVVESYTPSLLAATYDWTQRIRREPLSHTVDPRLRTRREMKKPGDYFTACQLDLAWLMPLPPEFSSFLHQVSELDPLLSDHGLLFPDLFSHVPIAVFELESGAGKHAGGGLLNLSAFGVLGVALTPNEPTRNALRRTLQTYQPTLGLRNVYVRTTSVPSPSA